MSSTYFVENASTKYFEEVDQFIYDNWKYVVNDADQFRYSGKRFASVDGTVQIGFSPTAGEMGIICRMLGITIPQSAFAPPMSRTPKVDLLIVKKGKSIIHYDPATGNEFKLSNNRRKKEEKLAA